MLRGHRNFPLPMRGGQQVVTIYDPAMPKRVNATHARVPAAGVDPFESIESRRRRLFPPCVQPAPDQLPSSTATERASEESSFARASPTDARIPNRNDAPVLHTTRRGSRAKAAAAVRDADPEALIQELIVDRHAASGVATAASLLRGWQHYHLLAHRHLEMPAPTYPVTADSII